MICNKLPKITAEDPATWDRLRVLPYEASFPKDASKVPKTPMEQKQKGIFPRDPNMDEKIKNLKQAFMWLFYERFKHITVNGKMEDPARVTEATSKYRVRNDHYGCFVIERMVFIPEENRTRQFINFDTIYKAFQEWYYETYPGSSLPSKLDAFEELKKKLKLEKDASMSRVRINSYRLKTTAEIMGESQEDSFNPQFGNMSIDNNDNENKKSKNKKPKKSNKKSKDDIDNEPDSDNDDLDNSDNDDLDNSDNENELEDPSDD